MAWVIHSKVFVNPNFGLAISCKSDHLFSDCAWDNHFWDISEASDGVIKHNHRLLFVESWDGTQEKWDSLSENKSTFLVSTESETTRCKLGSNDLNPVGGAFSLLVNVNFIIEISVRLDIEVVKVSLLSFLASHDFVECWFFNFFPFFWVVVQFFSFWVMVSHFVIFYWFY